MRTIFGFGMALFFSVAGCFAQEALPYKYVGSSFSHKFHRPSCIFAHRIWPEHLQLFHFRHQAVEDSYAPCRVCLPPVWTKVTGRILERKP
jgi:hypothetical protein